MRVAVGRVGLDFEAPHMMPVPRVEIGVPVAELVDPRAVMVRRMMRPASSVVS